MDTFKSPTEEAVHTANQVLGQYDIALNHLQIIFIGSSKVKLQTKCVSPNQNDVIVLSV